MRKIKLNQLDIFQEGEISTAVDEHANYDALAYYIGKYDGVIVLKGKKVRYLMSAYRTPNLDRGFEKHPKDIKLSWSLYMNDSNLIDMALKYILKAHHIKLGRTYIPDCIAGQVIAEEL